MSQMNAQLGWPRALLAVGFFMIMAGVVVGAATDGNPVAKYVAIGGVLPIAAALVGSLMQRVMRFRSALRLRSGR